MGEVGRYLTYEITTTSHPRMIGEERKKHVEGPIASRVLCEGLAKQAGR
jgi:hypothetical protein